MCFLLIITIGTICGCNISNWDCWPNKTANQPTQHVHMNQSVYVNLKKTIEVFWLKLDQA